MSKPVVAAFVLLASTVLIAPAGSAATLLEDAAKFGAREIGTNLSISPDGTKVLAMVAGAGARTVARIYDLATGASKDVLASDGGSEKLHWCRFAGIDILVCKFGGNAKTRDGLVPYSRLARVNTDGSGVKLLGQSASANDAQMRQFDGVVLDWLPDDDGKILMLREYVPEENMTGSRLGRVKSGYGVDRVDLRSMEITPVLQPRDEVSYYLTDGRGTPRIRYVEEVDSSKRLTGRTRVQYRVPSSEDWLALGTMGESGSDEMEPLAVDGPANQLYFLKTLNGRRALYRMTLDANKAIELVAQHPKVDIDSVTRLANGQKVIGYSFAEDRRRSTYFDKAFGGIAASLGKALPAHPIIDFVDASEDGTKVLLFAGSDNDPGKYYLLDRTTKKLEELWPVRPNLVGRALSSVKSITFKARDGTEIPAYLTLPAGSSKQTGLPAVVLPHGGPSARDEWGFDWLSQFLAARGVAVIQPNYRGSSGYGDDFQNGNAYRNWQQAISDINDSADYLVSAGIADPQRLAITGWSFGGYAALQAAIVEPTKYKAVAAIAPVTDLKTFVADFDRFETSKIVREMIGTGENVRLGSPLQRAAEIKVPVLLVHGDLDLNVGSHHSAKMAEALKSAGTPVNFLRFAKQDHYLEDDQVRQQMLVSLGKLLSDTVGAER